MTLVKLRLQIHPESFCEDVGDALYDEVTFLEVEEKEFANSRPSWANCV